MGKKPAHTPQDSYYISWTILIRLISFAVIVIIGTIGYLLLEDYIHAFFNQKTYTKQELHQYELNAQKASASEINPDRIRKGIHVRTGLRDDPNLPVIISACTSCHSAKMVTQNKATREGWKSMIVWMQATQGLPDLGTSEPVILDYLAKYYAPKEMGRRKNIDLKEVEWYVLNLED